MSKQHGVMQRLLHGWGLYLFLALATIALHLQAISPVAPRHEPTTLPTIAHTETTTHPAKDWWPEQSDLSQLQQAVQREPWLGAVAVALLVIILGMVLGGVGMVIWQLASGRLRGSWRMRPGRIPAWSFTELGRMVALIVLIASLFPFIRLGLASLQSNPVIGGRAWIAGAMMSLDVFIILTILTFATEKRLSISRIFSVSPYAIWPSIRAGLRGYMVVFPWLLLLLMLTVSIVRWLGFEPPPEPIQELIFEEHSPSILWLTVVLACVVGPLAEELFFRGVLYAALRRRVSRLLAMLISGALFAVIHTNVVGFVPILLLGCLLAERYERTGSLIAPIAVHMAHNSLLMGFALLFRHATLMGQ